MKKPRFDDASVRRNLALTPLKGHDLMLVDLIVARAVRCVPSLVKLQVEMDLTAVHRVVMPLRLRDLLVAPEFDLLHDVLGIRKHLDRETVTLTGHFVPRYAR